LFCLSILMTVRSLALRLMTMTPVATKDAAAAAAKR
jgi:hypothetical protein